jgi:hypothetical protein
MMRDMKNEAVAFLSFVWMPAQRVGTGGRF